MHVFIFCCQESGCQIEHVALISSIRRVEKPSEFQEKSVVFWFAMTFIFLVSMLKRFEEYDFGLL